jgi:hypothetical protein
MLRRRHLQLLLILVGAACAAPEGGVPSAGRLAEGGALDVQRLAATDPLQLEDHEVIALGYMERVRLGIGSPFRAAEAAMRDPRLGPESGRRTALAILDAVLRGESYRVDPAALDLIRLTGVHPAVPTGAQHLRLIEQTVEGAVSAESGERIVRIAYLLAEAERVLDGTAYNLPAQAGALVADRRRAREDARALISAAATQRRDPLEVMLEWRRDLRFAVERPALVALTSGEQEIEALRSPRLARSIHEMAQRLSTTRPARAEAAAAPAGLSLAVAQRLLDLAQEADAPPQAPIAVAVAMNRDAMLDRTDLESWQRGARVRFAMLASNEERLVAAAAELRALGAGFGSRLPLTEMQAAVFMRGWNQEEPWFPGDPAPTARDLETRFGLARLEFDRSVPEMWRPFYLRMLSRSLVDMQGVLPTMSLRGLTIRVGPVGGTTGALAIHDPRTRTIVLPPASGAGTIAHEIAHDLDWQLALRRYMARGGYATDLAIERRGSDRVAASVRGLTAAFVPDPQDTTLAAHETRAAESFARGMDWFIAAALARDGRSGGYLTSFQDAALTGYGTTRGPDIAGRTPTSIFTILDLIAPVDTVLRREMLEGYGPARPIGSKELVREIVTSGERRDPAERFAAIEDARDLALAALDAASCRVGADPSRRVWEARRGLVLAATGAAARGAAMDAVHASARGVEPAVPRRRVEQWLAWRLDGAPEPADSAVLALAPAFEPHLYRAAEVMRPPPPPRAGFDLTPVLALCGRNPFEPQQGLRARRGLAGLLLHPFPGRAGG